MTKNLTNRDLKNLAYSLSYGVYIITAADESSKFGMTAVWACQVSKDPVQIGIGITPTGKTAQTILKTQQFVINVLTKEQESLAYQFGNSSDDASIKFKDVDWGLTTSGIPYIKNSFAWLQCVVISEINLNSHYWIIGKVVDGEKSNHEHPALYHNGKIF